MQAVAGWGLSPPCLCILTPPSPPALYHSRLADSVILLLSGDHLTQGLKLSPSQVQTFLLWGGAALVIYWLLSLILGLLLALLGRILWGLKLVLFLVGFVALVRSVPDPSTRALLLLALLTLFALLSRLTGSRASGAQLEAKIRALERQVEEMRWRQRRAVKGTRGVEEE